MLMTVKKKLAWITFSFTLCGTDVQELGLNGRSRVVRGTMLHMYTEVSKRVLRDHHERLVLVVDWRGLTQRSDSRSCRRIRFDSSSVSVHMTRHDENDQLAANGRLPLRTEGMTVTAKDIAMWL